MNTKLYFTFGNKKYEYSISASHKNEDDETVTHVICEALNIHQDFLTEDVPNLILDFPNMLESKIEHRKRKDQLLKFRVSLTEKNCIEKKAYEKGYKNTSEYLRELALA